MNSASGSAPPESYLMPGIYDTRVVRACAAHGPFVPHASPARSMRGQQSRGEALECARLHEPLNGRDVGGEIAVMSVEAHARADQRVDLLQPRRSLERRAEIDSLGCSQQLDRDDAGAVRGHVAQPACSE